MRADYVAIGGQSYDARLLDNRKWLWRRIGRVAARSDVLWL